MSNLDSASSTLFVFIDESGNFDFTPKGTRYFVMAAVVALSPLESARALQQVRYELLAEGIDNTGFHATEDAQTVRDRVFAAISELKNLRAHVIYADKRRTAPSHQSRDALHALFSKALIRYIAKTYTQDSFSRIVIVLDQALPKKAQQAFMSSMKPELKGLGSVFRIYFHSMSLDFNGQIADYVAWSKFKQLERGENRPWKALQESIGPTDFDLFRKSWTTYY